MKKYKQMKRVLVTMLILIVIMLGVNIYLAVGPYPAAKKELPAATGQSESQKGYPYNSLTV